MKARLGILSLACAISCGLVAVTSMHFAMAAAAIGVGFALVGIGLLCEATDPRRKPNPRTAHPWAVPPETTVGQARQSVYDLYDREVVGHG